MPKEGLPQIPSSPALPQQPGEMLRSASHPRISVLIGTEQLVEEMLMQGAGRPSIQTLVNADEAPTKPQRDCRREERQRQARRARCRPHMNPIEDGRLWHFDDGVQSGSVHQQPVVIHGEGMRGEPPCESQELCLSHETRRDGDWASEHRDVVETLDNPFTLELHFCAECLVRGSLRYEACSPGTNQRVHRRQSIDFFNCRERDLAGDHDPLIGSRAQPLHEPLQAPWVPQIVLIKKRDPPASGLRKAMIAGNCDT